MSINGYIIRSGQVLVNFDVFGHPKRARRGVFWPNLGKTGLDLIIYINGYNWHNMGELQAQMAISMCIICLKSSKTAISMCII